MIYGTVQGQARSANRSKIWGWAAISEEEKAEEEEKEAEEEEEARRSVSEVRGSRGHLLEEALIREFTIFIQ